MQAVDDPARKENNPDPKWPVRQTASGGVYVSAVVAMSKEAHTLAAPCIGY